MAINKALLVGINYTGTDHSLNGCIRDVLIIRDLLLKVGYSPNNILLLTDSNDSSYKPTCANILAGFAWLLSGSTVDKYKGGLSPTESKELKKALGVNAPVKNNISGYLPPGSHIYWHYSGHGSYLADQNSVKGADDMICPLDFSVDDGSNGITDTMMYEQLASKVPLNVYLITVLDACFSGSDFNLKWSFVDTSNGKGTYVLSKNCETNETVGDVTLLSGCTDQQTSADCKIAKNVYDGALTYALISVLQKNNYKMNEDKLLFAIQSFITSQGLSDQTPCITVGKYGDVRRPFHLLK